MSTFKQLLWDSGFTSLDVKSKHEISSFLGVHYRTLERWLVNDKPSMSALKILSEKGRYLNELWEGFHIKNDSIITPNGYSYTVKELLTLSCKVELIRSQEGS